MASLVVGGTVTGPLFFRAVPEFADTPTAPPQLYGIHWIPVLGVAGAAIVILAVVIALSAANLLRGSRFTQLREAQA